MNLKKQYNTNLSLLNQTGIITPLPSSGLHGVVGINSMVYPMPTIEQIQVVFDNNKDLIERKIRQGFTQLQITPLAMPLPCLIEQAKAIIQAHAESGRIFRTKQSSADPDTPIKVNTKGPVWIWERIQRVLDTDWVIYFPKVYSPQGNQGMSKAEAVHNKQVCAFPGWSVGLIEPLTILPQPGQGRLIDDRQQLECGSSPREYHQVLGAPAYQHESGWTLEDFLTYFITQFEVTGQVSHDRADNNALWLLGQYLPDLEKTPNLVPVGYWSSTLGKKLYLSAHRTGNHFKMCGARTIVRLPG